MPLKPKELEDDIVREQNNIRRDPQSLIPELEDLLHNRIKYFSKRSLLMGSIGDKNFDEAINDVIVFLEGQRPVEKLQHSGYLEKAAKDFFSMDDPEEKLAERVEKYTEWDGELNEIVHQTKKGVTGRDVMINILLSDDIGTYHNKDIVFSQNFKYFGVKIGVNDGGRYLVVLDYATSLGSSSNPWINMKSKVESKFESKIDQRFSMQSNETNDRRTRCSSSRRKVHFDEIMGEIRKLNNNENDRSNDRSSLSPVKENKLISMFKNIQKKSPKEEKEVKRAPRKTTIINQSYLHEPLLPNRSFEHSSPGKQVRYSEAIPEDKYRISKEESSDDNSDMSPLKNSLANFSMKSLVNRWSEAKASDKRYGRASTNVAREDTVYNTNSAGAKIDVVRRFISRGGFNAAKSKYINDNEEQKEDSFEEKWNIFQEEQKAEEVKKFNQEDEYDIKSSTKYTRQSGFGRTFKNIDYGERIAYNKPLTQQGKYEDAMSYKPQPAQETIKYYGRSKNKERPTVYNNKSFYSSLKGFRDIEFKEKERIYQPITKEEFKLFKDFGTPGKKRSTKTTIVT